MLKLSQLILQSWLADGVHGYNSERGPPKDHSVKIWSQLAKQLISEEIFNIFPYGPMLKICRQSWLAGGVRE